ncbi:hypothetical protein SteCoe_28611 [Stentor coeruleus]|uniref:Uncharacterized protein n=1 Tax=Stentor coeruleus TaxID=5963 RepID=A0A1R2B7R9_9CILI|nr:hypothetical protein SteCoe_28611 [Stentor coeruleus]
MLKDETSIASNSDQSKQSLKFHTSIVEALRSRIGDLESSIEINRKLIYDLVVAKFNEINIDNAETSSSFSPKILENLIGENVKLEAEVKKSLKDLYDTQGKTLLSQQIANELDSKLNEITQEYDEKITEYQYQLKSKEKALEELKRLNKKLSDELSINIQSKNVFIVNPREDLLEVHTKVEMIKEIIQDGARGCYIANNYREMLSSLVKSIHLGCEKIQVLLKNPINRKSLNDKLDIRPLEEVPISDCDSESEYSNSSIEVSDINRNNTVSVKMSIVPKIDFSKIEKKNASRIINSVEASSMNNFGSSQKDRELKLMYFGLNDKITKNTEILERISSKNKTLQQQNILLCKNIGQLRESINTKKLTIRNLEEKNKSKSQYLEKINEVAE